MPNEAANPPAESGAAGSPQETEPKGTTPETEPEATVTEPTPKEPEKAAKETEKAVEPEKSTEPTIDALERDADGNYVWRVNPDDPQTSVYKGKSVKEVFQNAAKGFSEKDNFIRELRSRGLTREEPGNKESDTGQWPNREEIVTAIAAKYGIDPAMLDWSEDQWQEFEAEKGTVRTLNAYDRVKAVKRDADAKFSEENIMAINNSNRNEETSAVEQMLKEEGISAEEFGATWNSILDHVLHDGNSYNPAGILRTGILTASAAREIRKIVRDRDYARTTKEVQEKAAQARLEKKKVPTETVVAKDFNKPTGKIPASFDDAVAQVLAEMSKK